MKSSVMRNRCIICEYYRLVNYADGSSEIGCIKDSPNGYPVPIRVMDACPRGHSRKRCHSIDKEALLKVLGKIYAEVAVSPKYLSLYKLISASDRSLAGKRTMIALAIQRLGILKRVGTTVEGMSGRACTYSWSKSAGPPSYEMVDKIIFETVNISFDMVDKRRVALKEKTWKPRVPKTPKVQKGVTACAKCRLRDVVDCRYKLLALGYDCKRINVNTLSDEVTMGFYGQDGKK